MINAPAFTPSERALLLDAARAAIAEGLRGDRLSTRALTGYPDALCAPAACFVTLALEGALRGCIGTLEAFRPLVTDAAENAYAAAYRDPRFAPLAPHELARLDVHISVLSTPEPLAFASEQDLLSQLRPRIDGLILSDRGRRGTFLPAVWESLPDPREFLQELKVKAGLPSGYWSASIKVERYTTITVP